MSKDIFFTINSNTGNAVKSIKELEEEIKRLQKEWKTAEEGFKRNEIGEKLKSAKTELQGFNSSLRDGQSFSQKITSSITEGFTKIGGAIAGAFAVEKVIEFGRESVKAFTEAEKNATLLQNAVSVNGGLSEDFDRLIEQSSTLQDITIFSDDDIQKVQTAALQFGLTADQVENLLPIITDFASATGQDLNSALSTIISGVNGAAKGLKQYGITLKEGQNAEENFNQITQELNDKFKDQGRLVGETTSGNIEKLKNKYDDIQESVGEFTVSLGDAILNMGAFVLNGFKVENSLDDLKSSFKGTKEELEKLGSGILDFQIETLKNQINLGVGDVRKLQEQLEKLQQQKFSISIGKLDDAQLLKQIDNLEKKVFKTPDDTAYLKALKDVAEKRNLNTALAEKDLTKLTLKELKDRQAILLKENEKGNNKFVESSLDSVQKELKRREEAAGKAAEKIAANEKARQEEIKNNNEKASQINQQAYELEWKNKIDTAKEGADKLQAIADKAEQDAENLALKAAAKQKEIEGGGPEDKVNLARAELNLINQQRQAAEDEYTKNAVAAMRARVDETTQINVDGVKEETKNKVSELQKQLDLAKGNAAEERRINLEIVKTKIDGQIKETQAVINGLNEKKRQTGTLTKEEEKQAKDAADKLIQLNQEKNDAITKSDDDAAKEQQKIDDEKLATRIAAARAAADVVNQIIAESNRRAQEDIQNRLNQNEQAKTDRLAQLDAEYQREKEVRGASAALDKKYFDKKKQVEAEYEKQKAKLQLEAWKKDKDAKLKTSIINTALAVGLALATVEPPRNIAAAIIAGAAGLAQTAIILAQQPPKFSRGGILRGPSHSNGGIPLFSNGGQIYGEAEGGEVILTKNVSKSPELLNLASAINYAAGGRRFDRGGIITPITRFANGGIIEQAIGNNFNDLNATLASINQRLAEPPRAFVVEQEITAVQNKNALIERRSKIA